jgi:hypothetical protein
MRITLSHFDPDPALDFDADPNPALHSNVDLNPQHCLKYWTAKR